MIRNNREGELGRMLGSGASGHLRRRSSGLNLETANEQTSAEHDQAEVNDDRKQKFADLRARFDLMSRKYDNLLPQAPTIPPPSAKKVVTPPRASSPVADQQVADTSDHATAPPRRNSSRSITTQPRVLGAGDRPRRPPPPVSRQQSNWPRTELLGFDINSFDDAPKRVSVLPSEPPSFPHKLHPVSTSAKPVPIVARPIESLSLSNSIQRDETALRRLVKIQAIWRARKARKAKKSLEKARRTRDKVASEILSTERSYLSSLESVVNVALKPLRWNAQHSKQAILSEQDINALFSNIEQICGLSQQFYQKVEERMREWSTNSSIGDVFLYFAPFFMLYIAYCNNFEGARSLYKSFEKKPLWEKFWTQCQYHPDFKNMDLASFLIMPVQRIPRYMLLIRELLNHTNKEHVDYPRLQKALEMVIKISDKVNQSMKLDEKSNKMAELSRYFGSHVKILEPHRVFVGEGPVALLNTEGSTLCWMFLFNDLIIIAERISADSFIFKDKIKLIATSVVRDIPDMKYMHHLFSVTSEDNMFTFSCATEEEKLLWVEGMTNLIQEERQRRAVKTKVILGEQLAQEAIAESRLLEVAILGTEVRVSKKAYTVYVVQVKKGDYVRKIFKRYSEFSDLDVALRKALPNVAIAPMPKKNWFHSMKTKVIESRRLNLERYLQQILLNDQVRICDVMKQFLQIDESVLLPSRQSNRLSRKLSAMTDEDALKARQAAQRAAANEEGNVEDTDDGVSDDASISSATSKKVALTNVRLHLLDGSFKTFYVPVNTRASELCELMAKKFNVRAQHFGIYIVDHNHDIRVLDGDEFPIEVLEKAVRLVRRASANNSSDSNAQDVHLVFQKRWFFRDEDASDENFAHLLFVQAMQMLMEDKISLSETDTVRVAALFAQASIGDSSSQREVSIVLEYVPPAALKGLRSSALKALETNLVSTWQSLAGMNPTTAKAEVLAILRTHPLYGCSIYPAENYHKDSIIPSQVILGVRYDGLVVLHAGTKKLVALFPYTEWKSWNVYPNSILFKTAEKEYRFKTLKAYEAVAAVECYMQQEGIPLSRAK
eukprot:GILJ01008643.1.p1 GENE.GILJ01008643.1~~GILJ01008643.1.p1  ORF type:complete len:1062 (+),score=158.21 GILJ01008643.1:87-3272(+)